MSEEQTGYTEAAANFIEEHRQAREPGIWERYLQDVDKYIESKYPEIPAHARLDISAYISSRGIICTNDILIQRDREYTESLRKTRKDVEKYYDHLYKDKKRRNE